MKCSKFYFIVELPIVTEFQLDIHDKLSLLKCIHHISKNFSILCCLILRGFYITYGIKIKLTKRCQKHFYLPWNLIWDKHVDYLRRVVSQMINALWEGLHRLMILGINVSPMAKGRSTVHKQGMAHSSFATRERPVPSQVLACHTSLLWLFRVTEPELQVWATSEWILYTSEEEWAS